MNRRSSTARRRRARGAKWDPRQARLLMAGGGALLFVLISVFVWMLSGGPEPKELPGGTGAGQCRAVCRMDERFLGGICT